MYRFCFGIDAGAFSGGRNTAAGPSRLGAVRAAERARGRSGRWAQSAPGDLLVSARPGGRAQSTQEPEGRFPKRPGRRPEDHGGCLKVAR